MRCHEGCNEEFKPINFVLTHNDPKLFTTCQWRCHPFIYIVYRTVWALYTITWIILSGISENGPRWFTFLTNWSYFMLTCNLIIQVIIVIHYEVKTKDAVADVDTGTSSIKPQRDLQLPMTWYLKVAWIFYNIVNVSGMLVGICYWTLLHDASKPLAAVTVHTHGINMLYIIIDMCVTATPIRFYHVIHSVIYATTYSVFTVIYMSSGGSAIYVNIIEWVSSPGKTAGWVCVISFVACPILHFLMFALYKLRVFLYNHLCMRKWEVSITETKVQIEKETEMKADK